jgi:hypothetical protein
MLFAKGNLFLPIIFCLNKNIKLLVNYFLGPILFIILSYSLFVQISNQPDLPRRWQQIKTSWMHPWFWLVFALMFVNWGIETQKWKRLMEPLERFSFGRAFKAIMAGCSITMLTPNRIGEYGGRIMYVSEENRIRAISVTILGSVSQLSVTFVMGTIGILYLKLYAIPHPDLSWLTSNVVLTISILCSASLLLLFFGVHFFVVLLQRIPILKRIVKHIAVVDAFSGKQLLRILALSFLRYMVFILQYALLLKVMQVETGWTMSFCLLSVFYLAMVLAPTVGFTELPVRATASVQLFGLFSSNVLGIQAAAFGIWLINLVLPAIIGSLFILGVKIMKER